MKTVIFHAIITKNMNIKEFDSRKIKNYDNLRIQLENYENHENHINKCDNNENHENHRNPCGNYENH